MTIWISGYSLRAPESNSVQEFYNNLSMQKDMTTPSRRYPEGYLGLPPRTGTIPTIDRFDQDFFKFSTKQTDKMDIAVRLIMEVTQEALMDAKIDISSLSGSRTGVYVGHCFSDYLGRVSNDPTLTGYELVNGAHTMAANKLSYFYNLKGPSLVIDTACSSSLVALNQARTDLLAGTIDRAIVGGISLTLDPKKNATFNAFTMLSKDGRCFAFDTRANGYCRSEAIVAVILESSTVCSGGYAELLGTSVNSDGNKEKGITYPSGKDQAVNARRAFNSAGVNPESITYIEAHGTGTTAGDKQELEGLSKVFYGTSGIRSDYRSIPIGSVKSSMGHSEGASGLVSVVKCLLMYEHGELLPNYDFQQTAQEPLLDGRFKVVDTLVKHQLGNVCISNYGFGGTNAFAILGKSNLNLHKEGELVPSMTLSFSNSATDSKANSQWLYEQTLLGNDQMFKLRAGKRVKACQSIAFVYGGQGSQWIDMGKRLMSESETFRKTIERLSLHIKEVDDSIDLVKLFENGAQWMEKEYSVLGICAYQIAATNIVRDELGIKPDYYIGHSLGETAAGYANNIQTEAESIRIALVRSKLSKGLRTDVNVLRTKRRLDFEIACHSKEYNYYYVTNDIKSSFELESLDASQGDMIFDLNGQMVAVGLEADIIQSAINELQLRETCIACFNGPKGQTVSGSAVEVELLRKKLLESNPDLFWRNIDTDHVAYHAPHLRCYFDFLVKEFSNILGETTRSLDGKWLVTSVSPETENISVVDNEFHARNIVNPVYFQSAIEKLPSNTLVFEIGSSSSLLGQIKRIRKDIELVGLVERNKPETESIYVMPGNIRQIFWSMGYSNAIRVMTPETLVDKCSRLPLSERHPDLWNHEKEQRTLSYTDFEYILSDDTGSGMATIDYDLASKDSYLFDHQINGRALFPATGHIYTFWSAIQSREGDVGIRLFDFEILQAVVMDSSAEKLSFQVVEMDDRLAALYDGQMVAKTKYIVLSKQDAVQDAVQDAELGEQSTLPCIENEVFLEQQALYNHFRRYGYEYGNEFQLVKRRTLPRKTIGYGELKTAVHLIPFLDNLLQLFLDSPKMLCLPTMIRDIRLEPLANNTYKTGGWVAIDSNVRELRLAGIRMSGLCTMPAAGPIHDPLVNQCQKFIPFGSQRCEEVDIDFGIAAMIGIVTKEWLGTQLLVRKLGDIDESVTGLFGSQLIGDIEEIEEKDTKLDAHCLIVSGTPAIKLPKMCVKDSFILSHRQRSDEFVCEYELLFEFVGKENVITLYRSGHEQQESDIITSWEQIDKSKPQIFRGLGADGLVKTLRLEEGMDKLRSCIDDGSLGGSLNGSLSDISSVSLPLVFNHIKGGILGTMVTMPETYGNECTMCNAHNERIDERNVTLHIARPGDLSTLSWVDAPMGAEYDVDVEYSALNFKDIMYSFGKLRLERPSFGLEFSGMRNGKRVMGIGNSCIATKVKPALCWEIPENISTQDAATIPVVYLTSLYALFVKANLQKGQKVLIHAGTGGIGHSALYLCQARGIEVFTTCAPHKRQYIMDTFGIDGDHIGNSRDTSFREQVLSMTNGEGVDCVLNSLSGSLLDASLQVVKDFGHFCEIGKYDLQNNTNIGLKALECNVSYHAIDLATMFDHPTLSPVLNKLLATSLEAGEVTPLPQTTYPATSAEEALRYMSAGKHRGKVLLEMKGQSLTVSDRFETSGTHLITGGLGGFGMELAHWLFRHGADKVVATSRSGVQSGWQHYRHQSMVKEGLNFEISNLDVGDKSECKELLGSIENLRGVWHVAVVLSDGLFANMTPEQWNRTNHVKVEGLKNLDELISQDLDAFVGFSSVSSLFGNVGQSNYSYANNATETLILQRNDRGLKGVAIQWGMIDNVGLLAGTTDAKVLETFLAPQNIDWSLESLHYLAKRTGVWSSYRRSGGDDDALEDFELSLDGVRGKIADILGGAMGDYDPIVPLNDYGLDSLSSIEIVNWINRHVTKQINPSFMTPEMSIGGIYEYMLTNAA